MLHIISWQQYVTALLILTAAWYAYVGLTYYRAARGRLPEASPAPIRAVMGGIQADRDNQSHDAEELQFGPAAPDDVSEATLPKGPSEELLAEATILAGASGTPADFLSLLQVLLDKYESCRDEISLRTFTAQLLTLPLPFELSEHDLDLHWPVEN